MSENMEFFEYVRKNRRRSMWHKFVRVMACIVVFCTTYALILPAITQEQVTYCGYEEHTHNEICYAAQETGSAERLLCVLEETDGHTHGEDCYLSAHIHGDGCYDLDDSLRICGQEECQPHIHEENCYALGEAPLICTEMQCEPHAHGDGCYTMGEAPLICTQAEVQPHTHINACYGEAPQICVCGQEESENHTHGDDCYCIGEAPLICTLAETEGHVHGTDCYGEAQLQFTCTLEETAGHTHGEFCFGEAEEVLSCTLQETAGHTHSELCYSSLEKILVCTLEEREIDELICTLEEIPAHAHDETCYETAAPELLCELEEHTHELSCFADPSADLETASVWEKTLPSELTGVWAEDLLEVAKSQLGYTESEKNYQVLNDTILKGYSRYGHWAGDPYGDWSTYFVRFCLHYAEVPGADFPSHNDASKWIEKLNDAGLYASEVGFVPMAGDVIFLEHEGVTLTGIVTKANEEFVTAIMGDYENQVRSETIQLTDSDVLGYGMMPSREMELTAFASAANNSVMLANVNGYSDLTMKSVTYETDDKTNTGAEYLPDKDAFAIELNMNFDLTKEQIIAAGGKYTYLLPSTVTVPKELLNNTYVGKDKTGSDAFNYRFVKDPDTGRYRIYVDFLQEYVDTLTDGKTVEAYINFGGEADGSAVQDDGSIKIEFNDPCVIVIPQNKIEYPENETHDYSIQTNKWVDGNYDKTNKTQKYKVEIVSRKGTPSEIDFTDTLTGLGITGISIDSIVKVTYTKQDGWDQEGTPETISPNSQNVTPPSITMKLPGLVTTDTTYQKYVITYTVTTDEVAGGQAATLTNTAKASATTPGGGKIESSATTTTTISNKVLNKSGKYNTETKKVEWTITVNDTNSDIAGYWLTDSAFAGKTVDQLTAMLKIEPTSGYEIILQGEQPVVKFNALENESTNTNKYTITYAVDQAQSTLPGTVTNNAALNKENETVDNSSSTVTIPADGSIEKSLVSVDEEQNSLTWSMTVNVPNGGLAAGTYIKDVTTNQSYTLAQMTQIKNQLDTVLGNGKYTLQVSTDGWYFKDFDENTLDSGVKSFRIKINENITPQSNPFTLTYSTTANLTTGYTYSNEAGMGSENNFPIWDKEEIVFRHTVEKLDRNFSANDLTYVTTEDGTIGWIVKVYIERDCNSLTITDMLPDGVTLKRIGCTKDDWVVGTWINGTAISNPESVTIDNTTCTVSMLQADQMVTSTITAPTDGVIPGGNFVYVYYECRITDFTIQENAKLSFTNRVNVDMDRTRYGEDDQTQEVTFPDPITKMDSNGNANDSSMSYNNGYIGWFVKVFINKDTQSFTVEDQLPKGVTLKKLGANTVRDAAKTGAVDVTASSFKLTSNLPGSNATSFVAATETTGPKVTATFTADGTAVFSAGTTLYLYYECEIDSLDAGSTASFRNDAKLTIDNEEFEDSQTQTVTRPVRTEKLAANEHHQPVNEYKVTNSDGVIGWFVRVNLEEKPGTISVVDRLPEGVTLTKIGFSWAKNDTSYNAWQYSQQVGESTDGELTYGSHTAKYTISEDGKTVATDITSKNPEEAPSILYMYYECRINGIPAPGNADKTFTVEGGLTNSATVKVNDADPGDSVTNKQEVEINIPKAVYNRVDKSGTWMEGQNRINYQILLNEGGEKLAPDGGKLVLTDQMWKLESPFTANLVHSSVRLYEYEETITEEDGTVIYIPGDEIPASMWQWQYRIGQYGEQILEVTIPDEIPLVFCYTYEITRPVSDSDKNQTFYPYISNTATLNCSEKNSDTESRNETWKWSNTSGGVNSEGSFLFTKVETGNYGHVLPGVEFKVFEYGSNNPVATYTTNENGTFVITKEDGQTMDEQGNVAYSVYYQENVVYYVMETKALDGYVQPEEEDAPKYYFYFYNPETVSEDQPISKPEGVTVHDLNTASDAVYVENEKNSVDISVTKVWDVPEGTELPESITVKLMQSVENGTPTQYVYPTNDAGVATGTNPVVITQNSMGKWEHTFTDLPKYDTDGKLYTYSVVETPVDGYSTSYKHNTDGSWIITNKKVATTSIAVEKQWFKDGAVDSTTVTPVSFELWQVGSYTQPENSGGMDKPTTVQLSMNVGWYYWSGEVLNVSSQTVDVGSTVVIDMYTESTDCSIHNQETNHSLDKVLVGQSQIQEEGWTRTVYHYRFTYPVTGEISSINLLGKMSCNSSEYCSVDYSIEHGGVDNTWNEPIGDVVRKYDTYAVINHDGTLKKEISGLPVTGVDANGATLYYTYYVKEVNTSNWIGYENNNGITEGTILMKNEVPDETPSYELPETGGIGTTPYTLGGLAMLLCGAVLFLLKRRQMI